MAEDYWGDGYWGLGFWGAGFWGQGGTVIPPTPSAPTVGDKWVGTAILKRKLTRTQLQAIKAFFEAELGE
jgi:hypothetical protein